MTPNTNPLNSTHRQLVILAPSGATVPETFSNVGVDASQHQQLLSKMQKLRGAIYLKDGAIEQSDLSKDGRHMLAADENSWHLLSVRGQSDVCGCARYLEYRNSVAFSQLCVVRSALAQCDKWGKHLKTAVEKDIRSAHLQGLAYAEFGGWALAEDLRCTTEAVRTALSTYALADLLGGCLGVSTVTMRHCSASILQRIGGRLFESAGTELPSYYDPQYKCDMAMLRFDSRSPNPKYRAWIDEIRTQLISVPVICRKQIAHGWDSAMERLPAVPGTFAMSLA